MSADQPGTPLPEATDTDAPARGLGALLARFANWFNESVVGSPWTYIFCIAAVVFTYLLIPLQGYDKWNLTSGLFFNTTSSSVELITGVGAVVAICSVRRNQKRHHAEIHALHSAHRAELRALHGKLDRLHRHVTQNGGAAGDRVGGQ
jgi:prolipoprotein diacylglyceryltransferase